MSHKLRNLLAVLVAALTALAVTPVFAADGDATMSTYNSTVTVNGVHAGDTVYLYKVADSVIQKDNTLRYDFVTGLPAAYDTAAELQALSGTEVTTAANSLAANLSTGTAAFSGVAGANGTATISNVTPGYYVAVVKNTASDASATVYQNMLINTTPTAGSGTSWTKTVVTIDVKKSDVTVAKTIEDTAKSISNATTSDGYKRGDYIPFKISTAIPNYPSNSTYAKFIIKDQPTGITLVNTTERPVTVTVNGTAITAGDDTYTLTLTDNVLTITFAQTYILANGNAPVVVTYQGQLTAPATTNGQATNKATITYSPNPYTDKDNETDPTVTVKTYGYVFNKIDSKGGALEEATFTLYNSDGTEEIKDENGNVVTSTSTKATDGKAYVYFSGLAAGTYTVKETTVPAGKLAVADFTFTVSGTTATADNPATTSVTETNYLVNQTSVVDNDGTALPSTGGMGTTLFTVVGSVLVIGAACALVAKKRVEK